MYMRIISLKQERNIQYLVITVIIILIVNAQRELVVSTYLVF